MQRSAVRVRVDDEGMLDIVDPGLESLDLLRSIDPAFEVRTRPLPGFSKPRFQQLRRQPTGIARSEIEAASTTTLWRIHAATLDDLRRHKIGHISGVNLLELKVAIAERLLRGCVLCARRCGVNRLAGSVGKCGLSSAAYVAEHFVHVAEEPPINPSLVLNLRGCALRCRGCQQNALLDTRGSPSERLDGSLWDRLDTSGARSLAFVGGNPDESLASILRFIADAPPSFDLPVVWNNHAYMSAEAITLLDGVADAYVPDLKFFKESCAAGYARVDGYPRTARRSIERLRRQHVPLFVRILALPGHVECCHLPTIRWLAKLNSPDIFLSVRGQYVPDWRITERDGDLARRVTASELRRIDREVASFRLPMV